MLRFFLITLGLACAGCTAGLEVSSLAERTPTPESVSRQNPGGDAEHPVDAALVRLLERPLGTHTDYWKSVRVKLPDRNLWKGTRFKRYPTRAAFQYGDAYIAISVVSYTDAQGGDGAHACMKPLLATASEAASDYDIEVGPMQQAERSYRRGVEAIAWHEEAKRYRGPRHASSRGSQKPGAQSARARSIRALREAQPHAHVPVPKARPMGEMLVVRTSGGFETLFRRDRFVGAIVAYESWPGTCLVQGFAVRVGTDETLARQVVSRWVDEAAPETTWASWLRSAPPRTSR